MLDTPTTQVALTHPAAGPLDALAAGLGVDGSQLAAETAGFRGKAALDLREQDLLGPLRFASLVKCQHFFPSGLEVGQGRLELGNGVRFFV